MIVGKQKMPGLARKAPKAKEASQPRRPQSKEHESYGTT
jgi:hypothetical protein